LRRVFKVVRLCAYATHGGTHAGRRSRHRCARMPKVQCADAGQARRRRRLPCACAPRFGAVVYVRAQPPSMRHRTTGSAACSRRPWPRPPRPRTRWPRTYRRRPRRQTGGGPAPTSAGTARPAGAALRARSSRGTRTRHPSRARHTGCRRRPGTPASAVSLCRLHARLAP
jgi:hypothetical protein